MKTHFAFGLIFGVLISLTAIGLYNLHNSEGESKYDKLIRLKDAEIARLKLENEVMQVDTANWIVEHSELKGD
jgi:hypothetical protein